MAALGVSDREARRDEGAGLQGPAPRRALHAFHERSRTQSPTGSTRSSAWSRRSTRRRSSARARSPPTTSRERPRDPRAEPLLVHGPLLPRRVHPPQGPVHGQVAALQAAAAVRSTRTAACSPCAAAHRDEEAFITAESILDRGGMVAMYCEGGRSRTGKLAEQAKPGHRPARAGDRRADRAGGDPRLLEGAQLEAPAVPEGHRAVRRPDPLGARREPDARPAAGGGRPDLRRDPGALRGAGAARPHGRPAARARAAPRRAPGQGRAATA